MTLQEYANNHPITEEQAKQEAENAKLRALQEEASLQQRLADEKAAEAAAAHQANLDASAADKAKAFRLSQEVYKGACGGENPADLLLKAIKALKLLQNREQDYYQLEQTIKNVYAIGLDLEDKRAAELAEIENRLEIFNQSLEYIAQNPTPKNKAAAKDIRKAININKRRRQQVINERPTAEQLEIDISGVDNPFT